MEDELNFKTLFLRNLNPGISHHLGVLACPRTISTQQLRDLVQKAYGKQKMASETSAKTPAVLDFNTQSHGLALEGTQRQDSAKPPHREWNAPPSNGERDSHAGTRPKQRYDRWDGWTENSTASPHSQRTVNTLTSEGHETPPENPATELNSNSSPNTHSSVQQTPADETPQVPTPPKEHQISSDILNVSSQTPVPQLLGDLIEKVIARKF